MKLVVDAFQSEEMVQLGGWQVFGPMNVLLVLISTHFMQNLGFKVTKCGLQLVRTVTRVVGGIFQIR